MEMTELWKANTRLAVPNYPDKKNAVRLRALVLLLRYSGLRLGDSVTIERSRIETGGRLFLRTAKTGIRIFVPLPKLATDALDACPGQRLLFWTGESKKSVIGNWHRALKKLFKLANITNGHAHRFRHTFAAELLLSGATLTNVAQLLHYSSWVKGRQERLEADVRKAWPSDFENETVTTALQPTKKTSKHQ
jgi:integrase